MPDLERVLFVGNNVTYVEAQPGFEGLVDNGGPDSIPAGRDTGTHGLEVIRPRLILASEMGYGNDRVDYATPDGGMSRLYGVNREDPSTADLIDAFDLERRLETNSLSLADVDPNDYGLIVVAGGTGALSLRDKPEMQRVLVQGEEAGVVLGFICHATVAGLRAERADGSLLFAGKEVTAVSTDELENRAWLPFEEYLPEDAIAEAPGVTYTKADKLWGVHVVDKPEENMVFAQNPPSAIAFGRALVRRMQQRQH